MIQDDVIDEVDHLIAAARCLKDRGSYKVYAVATHGIFTKTAAEQLEESSIDEVTENKSGYTGPHYQDTLKSWLSLRHTVCVPLKLRHLIRIILLPQKWDILNVPLGLSGDVLNFLILKWCMYMCSLCEITCFHCACFNCEGGKHF